MEQHGVRKEQVGQVRGFADRQLRHPEDPMHPSNRRISVIIQYLIPPEAEAKKQGEESKAGKEPGKEGKPESKTEAKPEAKSARKEAKPAEPPKPKK